MKKTVPVLIIIILLVVDWLAFHNILQGESNPVAEWLTLVASILVFIYFGFKFLRKRVRKSEIH